MHLTTGARLSRSHYSALAAAILAHPAYRTAGRSQTSGLGIP
jgi:hypothetical protein